MKTQKWTETISEAYLFMMLMVFPLFICPDYANITSIKLVVFLVCLAAFALGLLACQIAGRKSRKEGASPLVAKLPEDYLMEYLPDLFLGLFLLSGMVSWLLSPFFGQKNADGLDFNWFGAGRFDGLLFYMLYALVFVLTARFCKIKKNYVVGFTVISFVMYLISVIQLSGINFMNFYPVAYYKGNPSEFFSTIGNADIMAGFLCMAVPLVAAAYVVYQFNKPLRAFFLLVSAFGLYVALSIGVDMSLVGLLGVFAIMIPLLMQNRRYTLKLLELFMSFALGAAASFLVNYTYNEEEKTAITHLDFGMGVWAALVALAALLVVWLLLRRFALERVNWKLVRWSAVGFEALGLLAVFCYFRFIYVHTGGAGLKQDLYELVRGQLSLTAGHNRIGIWSHALQMAKRNLWFGTGCGTFAETFRLYAREVRYLRYMNRNLDFAHNEYVHFLCTMGVSGLLLYLGFLASTAWRALKRIRQNPRILVLGAAVLGYSCWVFFCFSIVIITPIYWVLLGLLMREVRDTVKSASSVNVPAEPSVLEEPLQEGETAFS